MFPQTEPGQVAGPLEQVHAAQDRAASSDEGLLLVMLQRIYIHIAVRYRNAMSGGGWDIHRKLSSASTGRQTGLNGGLRGRANALLPVP